MYEEALLQGLKNSKGKPEDIKRVENRIVNIKNEMAGPPPEEEEKKEEKKAGKVDGIEPALKKENVVAASAPAPAPSTKPPESQAPPKEINLNNLILKDEVIDFTKVDKTQYDVVNGRMNDYRSAAEYFINNGIQKRAELMIKKGEHLKACLNIIKTGKKLDLIRIEPPLTPELMFGQGIEERIKSYQELIEKQQAKKNTYTLLAGEWIEKAKKQKGLVPKAKKLLLKASQEGDMLKLVQEAKQNQWQPLPIFHFETAIDEKEVIQEEIKENEIFIEYTPDPAIAGKTDYKIEYIIASKEQTAKGTFDGYRPVTVKIDYSKGIKHVHNAEVSLSLISSSMLVFTKVHGNVKAKLAQFGAKGTIPIAFTDEAKKLKLSAVLKITKPTKASEMRITKREEIVIDTIFPAFKGKSSAIPTFGVSAGSIVAKTVPLASKPASKKEVSVVVNLTQAGKDPPLPDVLPNLPKALRDVDVRDPDDIGNLICASYLEKKVTTYAGIIQKMSDKMVKVPEALSKKFALMSKNQVIIKNQIESGKLTPEMYKKYLENQYTKDQILIGYLKELKQNSKMAMVRERVLCIQEELKSLKK